MKIDIRKYSPEMLDAIMAIENTSFPLDAYPRSKFQSLHERHPDGFMVAFIDNEPAGYVAGLMDGPKTAYLDSMAVRLESRKKGVGNLLLDAFLAFAIANGALYVTLHVRPDNVDALRLYRAHKFVGKEEIPNYYSDKSSALLMRKRISSKPLPTN